MKDTLSEIPLLSSTIPLEVKRFADPRELPCRDMDLDCLTGEKPFGSYRRCYVYAPEMGKCPLLGLEE
jgi:hypothetical protein